MSDRTETTERETTKAPPKRPLTHIDGRAMSITGARALLKKNPPGQGVLHMHVEGMYEAPFYIEWLLDRLAKAQPKRRRKRRRSIGSGD